MRRGPEACRDAALIAEHDTGARLCQAQLAREERAGALQRCAQLAERGAAAQRAVGDAVRLVAAAAQDRAEIAGGAAAARDAAAQERSRTAAARVRADSAAAALRNAERAAEGVRRAISEAQDDVVRRKVATEAARREAERARERQEHAAEQLRVANERRAAELRGAEEATAEFAAAEARHRDAVALVTQRREQSAVRRGAVEAAELALLASRADRDLAEEAKSAAEAGVGRLRRAASASEDALGRAERAHAAAAARRQECAAQLDRAREQQQQLAAELADATAPAVRLAAETAEAELAVRAATGTAADAESVAGAAAMRERQVGIESEQCRLLAAAAGGEGPTADGSPRRQALSLGLLRKAAAARAAEAQRAREKLHAARAELEAAQMKLRQGRARETSLGEQEALGNGQLGTAQRTLAGARCDLRAHREAAGAAGLLEERSRAAATREGHRLCSAEGRFIAAAEAAAAIGGPPRGTRSLTGVPSDTAFAAPAAVPAPPPARPGTAQSAALSPPHRLQSPRRLGVSP